jgi:hypothetical protein
MEALIEEIVGGYQCDLAVRRSLSPTSSGYQSSYPILAW